MLYQLNLPRLCILMRPFIWQKMGRNSLGVRGRKWKISEKEPENQFFGLISCNFQDYMKNHNICDLLYCTAWLFQILKKSDRI